MTGPDGVERRKMSQDSVNRDRLLERVDANVTNLLEAHRILNTNFTNHTENDEKRFKSLDEKLSDIDKKDAFFYGKVYGGTAVVSAAIVFISKVLLK